MSNEHISADFPYESNYIDVYGSRMHYIEQGEGDPILFLHSVPVSSYVWRNVIPHIATLGRCIAPDLIGLGKSDKPNIEYTIDDHIKYINKFIETLKLKRITLVIHGWGSIIGFDYAMKHENNCKGLVFYEAYIRSFNEDDVSLPFQEQMYLLQEQQEDATYDILMNGSEFIDKVLPQAMLRTLSKEEMSHYREPFLINGSEKPLLKYLEELMHEGSRVNKIIREYSEKLKKSQLPKLMLYSVPGFITTIATVMWAKENLPNLEINEVGEALHYAQESNPVLMGEIISIWLQGIEQQITSGER